MSNLEVVHIVRRYGLVGGMESYVWELTHALTELGLKIGVICEQIYGSPSPNIKIHTVAVTKCSSRWRAMLGFRTKVDELITKQFADRKIVIHSHERTFNHQVTTFHGPPMHIKAHWWRFSWLNPRIKAWKHMERDELLGPQVKFVLPVSNRIMEQLLLLHPTLKCKRLVVAYPGAHKAPCRQTNPIRRRERGERFIFVGKEWKRKGLRLAVEVIEHYASHFNHCIMEIYGPAHSDLPRFIRRHPNLVVKGWSKDIPWSKYDALIHLATSEPFGMVVPEARSHGVPVLTTKLVGSTELGYQGVVALDASESVEEYATSLSTLINEKKNRSSEIKWTWKQLALKHMNEIYPLVT